MCARRGAARGVLSKSLMSEILTDAREIFPACGGEGIDEVSIREETLCDTLRQGIGHGVPIDPVLTPSDELADAFTRHPSAMSADGIECPKQGRVCSDACAVFNPIDGGREEEYDLVVVHRWEEGEG
jgi:hypothetical protein